MPIRLSFHGAARGVTGSCFRLETDGGQLLIDCGLFQGSKTEKELNYRPFPFRPGDIDAVILSHAHIDHSGLLPKLTKHGYTGPVHATSATIDLAGVMLPDSAYIQEMEVVQLNRRNAPRSRARVEPIYTGADAVSCLAQFREMDYLTWVQILPSVRAKFWNAGHLLGSASVELEVAQTGADRPLRILFSADIGPNFKLLQPDPQGPSDLDYVICEATYGDTDRPECSADQRRSLLGKEVLAAINPNGVLLIPSFAVERAQELMLDLSALMRAGVLPQIPIYVDSPMATKASRVFARHSAELESGADLAQILHSPLVQFTEDVEKSKALDNVQGFHIIIAASGMCEAGRIRHRLKNWLWRDEASVLLVGYQAEGTLGRILQSGATSVRIQGETFVVRARVRTIDLYSGHADGPELTDWIRQRLPIAQSLFVVHGEEKAMAGLAMRLEGILEPAQVIMPVLDETFELTTAGLRRIAAAAPPRLDHDQIARMDWHNDVSRLMLDINEALAAEPDKKSRAVLIRKLRRALGE